MKSVIGSSINSNLDAAIAEATANIKDPKGIIIMTDYASLPETAKRIQEKYPQARTIGTTGTAYHNTDISDHILILTAIESEANIETGVIKHLNTCPVADLDNLENSIKKSNHKEDNTVCVEYCTNDEEQYFTGR